MTLDDRVRPQPIAVADIEPASDGAGDAGLQRKDSGRRNRRLMAAAAVAAVLTVVAGAIAVRPNRSADGVASRADLSGVKLPAPVVPVATDTDGFRLWLMTTDGQRQVPITDFYPEASALGAVWSPDGTRIAFHAGDGLYVVNADGTGLKRLPGPAGVDPSWSPDGQRIAFAIDPRSGMTSGLYTMHLDGSSLTRLGDGRKPSWSVDGSRIAFEFTRDAGASPPVFQVGVMNADGTGWALLPVPERHGDKVSTGSPSWSPDGQWLVFDGSPLTDGARWSAIYRSRPDGADLQELVREDATAGSFQQAYAPAWSLDASEPGPPWDMFWGAVSGRVTFVEHFGPS